MTGIGAAQMLTERNSLSFSVELLQTIYCFIFYLTNVKSVLNLHFFFFAFSETESCYVALTGYVEQAGHILRDSLASVS